MVDFATIDLSLAVAHHLLIFLLAGVLAFEIGVIRSSMKREDILRIASVDNWYGILAVAILAVGFSRAIYAAKGWAYYQANGFFWARSRLSLRLPCFRSFRRYRSFAGAKH
jgi:putative membrane protein